MAALTGVTLGAERSRAQAWRAVRAAPSDATVLLSGDDSDWARWGRAVCVMARGDYAGAMTQFTRLAALPGELGGLAAAALASGWRQLGGHLRAGEWDDMAADRPGAARADGLIGAAADRIGLLDPDGARAALDRCSAALIDERDLTRRAWVEAEWHLLVGDPGGAVEWSVAAVEHARAYGGVRHLVKSRLFLAVARDTDAPGTAGGELAAVASAARSLGLRPLLVPAVAVLGPRADPQHETWARDAAAYIAAHAPSSVSGGNDAFG